jgi:hypothetical protein
VLSIYRKSRVYLITELLLTKLASDVIVHSTLVLVLEDLIQPTFLRGRYHVVFMKTNRPGTAAFHTLSASANT